MAWKDAFVGPLRTRVPPEAPRTVRLAIWSWRLSILSVSLVLATIVALAAGLVVVTTALLTFSFHPLVLLLLFGAVLGIIASALGAIALGLVSLRGFARLSVGMSRLLQGETNEAPMRMSSVLVVAGAGVVVLGVASPALGGMTDPVMGAALVWVSFVFWLPVLGPALLLLPTSRAWLAARGRDTWLRVEAPSARSWVQR